MEKKSSRGVGGPTYQIGGEEAGHLRLRIEKQPAALEPIGNGRYGSLDQIVRRGWAGVSHPFLFNAALAWLKLGLRVFMSLFVIGRYLYFWSFRNCRG